MLTMLPNSLIGSLLIYSISTDDIIHQGEHGYSTYYEGNGPLIIMSHHNGQLEPLIIPDRHSGCWNGTHCIWEHNCQPQDSTNCGITTVSDSYTKQLATCIYHNTSINTENDNYKPHLIINELRRTKLDPNRYIGEAALKNNRAEQTWNEIHNQWSNMAKNININNCGFAGLVIDIHGQASNDYINLGYRLRTNVINLDDFELNDEYLNDISIRSMIINNGVFISDAIRGFNALGTILTGYGYEVLPSFKYRTIPPEVTNYFAGATVSTLGIHGSQNLSSITDAIQIEINRDLRFDENIRQQFCNDFSKAIVEYLNYWYDIEQCRTIHISQKHLNHNTYYLGLWNILLIGMILFGICSITGVFYSILKYMRRHKKTVNVHHVEMQILNAEHDVF